MRGGVVAAQQVGNGVAGFPATARAGPSFGRSAVWSNMLYYARPGLCEDSCWLKAMVRAAVASVHRAPVRHVGDVFQQDQVLKPPMG